jgi:hypothetical protein
MQTDTNTAQVKEKKLKNINTIRKEFHETTPSKLITLIADECIFTKRFLELLTEKLGSAETFKGLYRSDQEVVAETVQNLLIAETSWKALISKSRYEEKVILKMFPKEFDRFDKLFNEFFFPHGDKVHHKQVHKKFASVKCAKFYENFLRFLLKKKIPILKKVSLKKLEIDYNNLASEIEPVFLFKDLVKLSMKKAFDQSINIEQKNEKLFHSKTLDTDKFLYVRRDTLLYAVQEVFRIYLADQVLTAVEEKLDRILWSAPDKKIRFIYDFFKEHEKELMSLEKK